MLLTQRVGLILTPPPPGAPFWGAATEKHPQTVTEGGHTTCWLATSGSSSSWQDPNPSASPHSRGSAGNPTNHLEAWQWHISVPRERNLNFFCVYRGQYTLKYSKPQRGGLTIWKTKFVIFIQHHSRRHFYSKNDGGSPVEDAHDVDRFPYWVLWERRDWERRDWRQQRR